MDKLIEILLSILSGAIAGGITASIVINKNIHKQKTKGNNSPIIGGDVNKSHIGDDKQ